MGRVNRLMERRALRRAAEAALINSMQQRPVDATAGWPGGAPDQDFEYTWSAPDDTGVSYDRDPVTEPIPVAEVQNLVPDQPDDYAWDDHDEVPAGSAEIPPEPVDVYELVPEQPDDHEWDDDRDEVPPAAVEVRPLRARPLAAGDLVHPAVGMPMPENLAAVVPHQAGGEGARRRSRRRRRGVRRLAGAAEPEHQRRTIDDRCSDERPACPEQGPTHRGERSAAAPGSPTSATTSTPAAA